MLQIISLLHALRVMAASHLVCLLQPNVGDAPAAFLASADALITHRRCSFPSLHHHHPRPPAAANTSCHCTPQAYSICLLQPDACDDFVAVATNAQTLPLLSPSPSHRASCYTYHFFLNAPLRPTLSVSCSQMHGMLLWLFMASVDALSSAIPAQPPPTHSWPKLRVLSPLHALRLKFASHLICLLQPDTRDAFVALHGQC